MSPLLRGQRARLGFLTAELGAAEWSVVGAVAALGELGAQDLGKLAQRSGARALVSPRAGQAEVPSWWERLLANGLLVAGRPSRALSRVGTDSSSVSYRVHPEFRQLVLRELQSKGQLEELVSGIDRLLGAGTPAALQLALQRGEFEEFVRLHKALVWAKGGAVPLASAHEVLRASVCEPFDAGWFERTWGDHALNVAEALLREGLQALDAMDELYRWMLTREALPLECVEVLCEHAALRGDVFTLQELNPTLAAGPRLGFQAVLQLLAGELGAAHELLDQSLGWALTASDSPVTERTAGAPNSPTSLALGALLLLNRNSEQARELVQRLAQARGSALASVARGIRTLRKYLTQPEERLVRLDVHQVGTDASAWELYLLGLTVHLTCDKPWTRASWAKQLAERAVVWWRRDYRWFARQVLGLARALSEEYTARELTEQGQSETDGWGATADELMLVTLITPKRDWEKTLDLLSELSKTLGTQSDRSVRVSWYVNLAQPSLSKPALQEREAERGWSAGRRLSIEQLLEVQHELPEEDVRVLRCTREGSKGQREFTPEAFEALIGHSRVVDATRGARPISVVSGTCRVEVSDLGDELVIAVRPEGAELGIHVQVEDQCRLVVYRVTPAVQQVLAVLPHGLKVPKTHAEQVFSVLGSLSQSVVVHTPALGETRVAAADATPCVRIAPHAGAWMVVLGVRPFGVKGRFFIAATGRERALVFREGQQYNAVRDFASETARVSELIQACATLLERIFETDTRAPGEPMQSFSMDELTLLQLLLEIQCSQLAVEFEWPDKPGFKLRGSVGVRHLQGTLQRKKGWYLAAGSVKLDAVTELTLAELASLPALGQGRFVRLPNGDYLAIEERLQRVLLALGGATPSGEGARRGLRLHQGSLTALRTLADPDLGLQWDAEARGWLERVETTLHTTFALPEGLVAELRPYQVEGVRWLLRMAELDLGACLADDMGLGKTVQIIALLLHRSALGPALVVAPTSVCTNWLRELQRFAPSLTPIEYTGPKRAALLAEALASRRNERRVFITSYQLLQQDAEVLRQTEWSTLVLDEAQLIKNPHSQRARAAFSLLGQCRVAATGTPVENQIGDLWSVFRFLNPGLLGPWQTFQRSYVRPIERDGDSLLRARLRDVVRPYLLRRTKPEVLPDLPPLTTVQHDVRWSEDEAMRYALLRRQIHDKLHTSHGKRNSKLEILAEITRLRRFCCHPRLVFPDADSECSKINALLELVEELSCNDHRALVFSQFVDFLALVRERLDERRISYQYLDGSTPKAERQVRVDAFQAGEGTLFLISLKAGGFGLNLTAADYVIHLDPWWNPAVESQATDRAHRIHQQRPVTVYRLITRDSIEESIVALHETKRELAESLLQGSATPAQLSTTELIQLIEAPGSKPRRAPA